MEEQKNTHRDGGAKRTCSGNNEAVQMLFAGFCFFLIVLIIGVIFFINPECKVEYKAYACVPPPTPTPTPIPFTSLGSPPTDDEWNLLSSWFPNADRDEIRIMDRSDNRKKYNCAGWSVKRATNDFWEPYRSVLEYGIKNIYGYDECSSTDSDCSLILWDDPYPEKEWTHVMNMWEGEGPPWNKRAKFSNGEYVWESKCGDGRRIVHRRDAILGSVPPADYGYPIRFYEREE